MRNQVLSLICKNESILNDVDEEVLNESIKSIHDDLQIKDPKKIVSILEIAANIAESICEQVFNGRKQVSDIMSKNPSSLSAEDRGKGLEVLKAEKNCHSTKECNTLWRNAFNLSSDEEALIVRSMFYTEFGI